MINWIKKTYFSTRYLKKLALFGVAYGISFAIARYYRDELQMRGY